MSEEKVNNLFEAQDQGTSNAAAGATPGQAAPGVYSELVGEGKKFRDSEALAKSKLESDRFVEKLKAENAEMRKELEARLNAESVARKLAESRGADQAPASEPPSVDEDSISRVLEEKLSEREMQQAFQKNFNEAQAFIIGKAGSQEAAMKLVMDKARELGVQPNWLQDMAMRTPKALYALLGLVDQAGTPSTPSVNSDVNAEARRAQSPNNRAADGSKAYFEDIRKKDPARYWSAAIQNQIFKAAKEGKYK